MTLKVFRWYTWSFEVITRRSVPGRHSYFLPLARRKGRPFATVLKFL
jgi:hypothetical protein